MRFQRAKNVIEHLSLGEFRKILLNTICSTPKGWGIQCSYPFRLLPLKRTKTQKHRAFASPRISFCLKNIFPLESSKNTQKGRLTDLTVSFLTRSFYQKGQVSTWVPGPWEKSSATTTIPGFPAKLWWTSANHFLVPSGNTHVAIKNVAFEDVFPINNGEFSSPC